MGVDTMDDFEDTRTASRDQQQARRAREIVSLLERRSELRGLHPLADLVADAVRWTA